LSRYAGGQELQDEAHRCQKRLTIKQKRPTIEAKESYYRDTGGRELLSECGRKGLDLLKILKSQCPGMFTL